MTDDQQEAVRDLLDLFPADRRQWAREYLAYAWPRYQAELRDVERLFEGGDILEVGSVPCQMTWLLQNQGYPVVGVDLDPSRAGDLVTRENLVVKACDIEVEPLPFDDDRFGLVLFCEVLEHLRINPLFALEEIGRVTKKGGRVLLSTPNLYTFQKMVWYLRGRGLGDPVQEFRRLEELGFMGHYREYAPREVRMFLHAAGFRLDSIEYRTYVAPVGSGMARWARLAHRLVPRVRRYQVITARRVT